MLQERHSLAGGKRCLGIVLGGTAALRRGARPTGATNLDSLKVLRDE